MQTQVKRGALAGAGLVVALSVLGGWAVASSPSPGPAVAPVSTMLPDPGPSVRLSSEQGLAQPDATLFPAKGCGRNDEPIVTFTIDPDGPLPSAACAIVGPDQRLRIVNGTNNFGQPGESITLDFAGLPRRTVARGASTTYDVPFGRYLARGQHELDVSYGEGVIIVWLQ